ncbi:oxidoreductase [Fulvivirga sp. RKSG066]|uniref:oxidoreductase n=1 Tax=Fulvivirga aurantia TaxID=2529383 RepID=UPI0012BCB1BD|nr:oxidoreductase [Fulvivirga aurantia]MTI21093.1 oxidoreductase [Fulvivirga aurantia]
MSKTAIIAGSTGLIGEELLQLLLDDPKYQKVIAISRRPLQHTSKKLMNVIADLESLDDHKTDLKGDDVFCCLGTTMKNAGSKEKFRAVDYEYPLKLAKITKDNGASQYLLISALGADKQSSVFYNKVKGEVEEAISGVNFQAYHIFRPSLLIGSREETRVGEGVAQVFFKVFGFLFQGPLKKYKAIKYDKVARAMQQLAQSQAEGKHVHESKELQKY